MTLPQPFPIPDPAVVARVDPAKMRQGIPSARKMRRHLGSKRPDSVRLGELAGEAIIEYLTVVRHFVVAGTGRSPYLGGYLEAFDRAVERETSYFRCLPDFLKSELGAAVATRGILDELIAYDAALRSGTTSPALLLGIGTTIKEELKELLPFWVPDWLETVLASILEVVL